MRKKEKKEKKKRHVHKFTFGVIFLDLVVIAALVVINTSEFKAFWIPTAMTTMTHKYLAYTLYDEDTVNKVMSENYIEQNTDEVNLDDVVIGDTTKKTHFTSKYEEDLYTRNPGNDVYKIIRLEEKKFKGYLTVIYDPADVDLAIPQKLGKAGESVNTLCKKNGGLVGINGGGFEDLDGWGNGSIPYGAIINNGDLVWTHSGGSGQLIGFTKEHKLWLTNDDPATAISKGMVDAVEFGPNLIVNGKVSKIHGDGGWGTAPRSVIAQRRDGVVLFLVTEGVHTSGPSLKEVIDTLELYGAYNAANLDGGTSAQLVIKGELINTPKTVYGKKVSEGRRVVSGFGLLK